jgi:hypothetical protein
MMADPELGLTHAQFGTFMSALSIPNMILPFVGGLFLDMRGSRTGTVLMLLIATAGHVVFVIAIANHSYIGALIGTDTPPLTHMPLPSNHPCARGPGSSSPLCFSVCARVPGDRARDIRYGSGQYSGSAGQSVRSLVQRS